MENKCNVLNYRLKVKGLFGRNRKIKFETYKLLGGVDPITPKALDELLPLMRAKLAEIKFKGGRVWLDEEPVELSGGFETFALCSGKTLHQEQIEGGGVIFGG